MSRTHWFVVAVAAGLYMGCSPPPVVNTDSGPDAPATDIGTTSDVASTDAADVVTPGDGGEALPNLTINGPRMRTSAMYEVRAFGPTSCEVMEGCITAPGNRRLLRFDLETPNDGLADVNLGTPTADDPRFEFGTCHGHRHFRGYARYTLLDGMGAEVGHGQKESFCLEDTQRTGTVPSAGTEARYGCAGPQGIQSGWSDVYGRHLDCQFVDITDLPAGRYRLRADVNVNRGIIESDYTDNRAEVDIDIPAAGDAGVPDAGGPMDVLTPCAATGEARNCGWTVERTRMCTAGTMVNVGCNARCSPALGSCTGDTVLRVCPGDMACNNIQALAQNDDSCAPAGGGDNFCSSTSFMCPPSGQYTVLTGAYAADRMATCTIAVSP